MASDTVRRVVEVDSQVIMTEYTILREYEDVFTGLEKLPGKHHIHFDKTVKLVLHAPRKVQVASRDNVETELTRWRMEVFLQRSQSQRHGFHR